MARCAARDPSRRRSPARHARPNLWAGLRAGTKAARCPRRCTPSAAGFVRLRLRPTRPAARPVPSTDTPSWLRPAAAADVGPQPLDLLGRQRFLPRWHRALALHHRLLEAVDLVDRKLAQIEHRGASVDHVAPVALHAAAVVLLAPLVDGLGAEARIAGPRRRRSQHGRGAEQPPQEHYCSAKVQTEPPAGVAAMRSSPSSAHTPPAPETMLTYCL